MTARKHRIRGGLVVGLVVAFVAGGMLFDVREARADPHAIFYTAIGQQQLFFNVLAALDQADYVEPASVPLQFSRQQLEDQRAQAAGQPKFLPESFPQITETETDLAAILTRPITLEGVDARTVDQVRQLSADRLRQAGQDEFARLNCDYGLGLDLCDLNNAGGAGGAADIVPIKEGSFVHDPLSQWAAWPYQEGVLGALSSGSDIDEQERDRRLNTLDKYARNEKFERNIRADSPDIRRWREALDAANNTAHAGLLDSLLVGVAEQYVNGGFGNSSLIGFDIPYGIIQQGSGGNLTFTPQIVTDPGSGQLVTDASTISTPDDYLFHAAKVALAPTVVGEIAEGGRKRIIAQQEFMEQDGFRSDFDLKAWSPILGGPGVPGLGDFGELSLLVDNPAKTRSYSIKSALDTVRDSDSSRSSNATGVLDQYGTDTLLSTAPGSGSSFASLPGGGTVAGIYDNRYFASQSGTPPSSPQANTFFPHRELEDVVGRLTSYLFDDFDASCGFSCPF